MRDTIIILTYYISITDCTTFLSSSNYTIF
nr:MAG TPA: hypothetical protein [Caudoviricetes sp.]